VIVRNSALPITAFLILLTALVSGCGGSGFGLDAIGPDTEILVVVDSTVWEGPVGNAVRGEIAPYLATLPSPEREFDLRALSLRNNTIDRIRSHKNIIFVAPIDDPSPVGDFIRNRLPDGGIEAIRDGGRIVAARPDLWRRNQRVYFISAADTSSLVATLEEYGPALRDTFNLAARRGLHRDMFRRARQTDVEEQLMERHDFAVNVQYDYILVTDTTDFVWLRRVLTDTWRSIFVHYIEDADPAIITPEWMTATRDSLTQQYVQGNVGGWVEIDQRRPLEAEEVEFGGRYAYEMRGLWHMVSYEGERQIQYGMGGPFVSYAFYDQHSGRVYFVDGMVFAPDFGKREFLRQVEVIAHTFRSAGDVEAAEAQQVASR